MGAVRIINGIYFVLAWVVVILGVLGTLIVAGIVESTMGKNAPPAIAVVLYGLFLTFLMSLGLFFSWALLKVLCELHSQGERILESMDDVKRAAGSRGP